MMTHVTVYDKQGNYVKFFMVDVSERQYKWIYFLWRLSWHKYIISSSDRRDAVSEMYDSLPDAFKMLFHVRYLKITKEEYISGEWEKYLST